MSAPLQLANTGSLRVGINLGNALLASREADGNPRGIAVDLAQELSRRLGVRLEIVGYDTAGRMADGAKAGAWDVAFLGIDPAREEEILFTAPYLQIDTTYLVPVFSPLHNVADVDRAGLRISVSEKSAYDLFLTRHLHQAQLVRTPGVAASVDVFFSEKLDALAGLKPFLMEVAEKHPRTRLLDGRFTVVSQAVGTPRGHDDAARYLCDFVEEIKTSGMVAKTIDANGVRGVSVAPLASRHVERRSIGPNSQPHMRPGRHKPR